MQRKANSWIGLGVLVSIAYAAGVTGCGGSDSAPLEPGVPSDAGTDTPNSDATGGSGHDAMPDQAGGTGGDGGSAGTGGTAGAGGSAGSGGATGCTPEDSACVLGSSNGLCKQGACAACTDPGDDATCESAYGSGSNSYLCIEGSCTPGDCRTSADCSGLVCGLQQEHFCGKCSTDQQCQSDPHYGSSTICSVATGTCVSNACNNPHDPCTANPADVCCSVNGTNQCISGDCCTSADCSAGYTCQNHVCTQCQTVSNGAYYVDPVNGSDAATTGSQQCPFKTITHAIAFLGSSLPSAVQVLVKGGTTASTSTGEKFPIVVPKNVVIMSDDTASPATVSVSAGKSGFVLGAPSSGLAYLIIDGATNSASTGIVVQSGSNSTTTLDHVTVRSFLSDGILVRNSVGSDAGGVLSIGAGVISTSNGTTSTRASGLRVTDNGSVSIQVSAGQAQTRFDSNTNHGISVEHKGAVTLTGTAGTGGSGTVATNGNTYAGVWIKQTPGTANPVVTLDGLVSWANTDGNGIRIFAGSNAKVRRSYVLANAGAGILVTQYSEGSTISNDVSKIDLGTSSDWGKNVVQATTGSNPNIAGGICLTIAPNAGMTLAAAGNIFSGGRDCSTSNPGAITRNNTCTQAVDIGLPAGGSNDIDTSNCTHP